MKLGRALHTSGDGHGKILVCKWYSFGEQGLISGRIWWNRVHILRKHTASLHSTHTLPRNREVVCSKIKWKCIILAVRSFTLKLFFIDFLEETAYWRHVDNLICKLQNQNTLNACITKLKTFCCLDQEIEKYSLSVTYGLANGLSLFLTFQKKMISYRFPFLGAVFKVISRKWNRAYSSCLWYEKLPCSIP